MVPRNYGKLRTTTDRRLGPSEVDDKKKKLLCVDVARESICDIVTVVGIGLKSLLLKLRPKDSKPYI